MNCPGCRAEIEAGARFCGECGLQLGATCPGCGEPVPEGKNFCRSCGTAIANRAAHRRPTPRPVAEGILGSRAAVEGERKHVTVLFADVRASMEMVAGRDPEEAGAILDPVLQLMMEAVHHHEGTVNQVMGDGIMALFGAPLAHEDHAVRACYAALRIQESVRRYGRDLRRERGIPLQFRIGLNSGEVVVRSLGGDLRMDYTAVGQTTHVAARMEQIAAPDSILISAATQALAEGFVVVKPLGPVAVKGLAQPLPAYELVAAKADRSRFAVLVDRGLTQFVGRGAELEQLERAFTQAVSGRGAVVAVAGEPGVGKSRLLWEFAHANRSPAPRVLASECESHAVTTAYHPVAKLLRRLFGLDAGEGEAAIRDRVVHGLDALGLAASNLAPPVLWLLGIDSEDEAWRRLEPSQRRQCVLEAVTELLVGCSAASALVLAIEDLQWIDSESQAVLDRLVDCLDPSRILMVVSHRPGFEHRWRALACYRSMPLDQLPAGDAADLLDALVGGGASLRGLKQELIERTGGNAFFLEESVRTLAETGVLAGTAGNYRMPRDAGGAQIPASVHAVLAARIDRLPEGDKRLLQAASAIGAQVPAALLRAIAELSGDELRGALARLTDGGFLRAQASERETEYGFKHTLTFEVAYQSLVLQRRRSLHATIVAAIERLHPDEAAQDRVEQLAHHALRGEVWPKALRYCAEAGRRALARSANRAAVTHFERALGAVGHLGQTRETVERAIDLRIDLRNAYGPLGEHKKMFEALKEAEVLARQIGDQRRLGLAISFQSNLYAMRGEFGTAVAHGRRALEIAETLGDLPLRVVSSAILAINHWSRGEYRKAVERARWNVGMLTGDLQFERMGMAQLPAVYSRTSMVVSLAELGEFAESFEQGAQALSIAEASGHPQSLISACFGLGSARMLRGDFGPAIEVLERGMAAAEATGLGGAYLELVMPLASAYCHSGRIGQAMELLQTAVARAIALRNSLGHWIRSGGLGEALLCAGRAAEALPMARLYLEATRSVGARGNEAWALRLLGEVQAEHGGTRAGEAMSTLGSAVTLARELEMRPLEARCQIALGRVQRGQGAYDAAQASLRTAADLFRGLDMPFWVARAGAETG